MSAGFVFGFFDLFGREHFGDHASRVQRSSRRDQVPHVCLDQIVRIAPAEQATIFSSSLSAPNYSLWSVPKQQSVNSFGKDL